MGSGEWETVLPKKRRKRQHARSSAGGESAASLIRPRFANVEAAKEDQEWILRNVQLLREEVAKSRMFGCFKKALSALLDACGTLDSILVYGLGTLQNICSRRQLAFILELQSWLRLTVEMYDPLFNNVDLSTFSHLGLLVLEHNEHCKRVLKTPTFVYMPHCEVHLHENIVSANLCAGTLNNLVLLSNHLPAYSDHCLSLEDTEKYVPHSLLKTIGSDLVHSFPIEELDLKSTHMFHATSLHVFQNPTTSTDCHEDQQPSAPAQR